MQIEGWMQKSSKCYLIKNQIEPFCTHTLETVTFSEKWKERNWIIADLHNDEIQ